MINLLNNCFGRQSFTKPWKEARLEIVPKDEKRDRSLVSSYRPITLLSVVGKIYEKITVQRLQCTYKEQGLESPNQFGFRRGKSTDDAFIRLRRAVKHSDKKYTIVLFVDIEGDNIFDNIWWTAVKNNRGQMQVAYHQHYKELL